MTDPLNEIAQEVRSKHGHSVEALSARIRNYRRGIKQLQKACAFQTQLREKAWLERDEERRNTVRVARELADQRELLKMARDVIKNTPPAEPCRRLHLDVSVFAYLCVVALALGVGYLLGRLHG